MKAALSKRKAGVIAEVEREADADIAKAEADVALLDQEETVLGYMAKLIALDAMALSDAVVADELAPGAAPVAHGASVNAAIDLFVTR